jgi:hypothetical protein
VDMKLLKAGDDTTHGYRSTTVDTDQTDVYMTSEQNYVGCGMHMDDLHRFQASYLC